MLTWVVCVLLGALLGPAAGRPHSALTGMNTGYPVTWLAVAVAVAATALPYLSRPVHRLVWFLVPLAVLAGVCGGAALPVNAISSMAVGWGIAAAVHLAAGSPLGLPSAAGVAEWISDLNVAVTDITRARRQVWGSSSSPAAARQATTSSCRCTAGTRRTRVLAKLWRFCVYRDSGPTLVLDRLQQVEHGASVSGVSGARPPRPRSAAWTAIWPPRWPPWPCRRRQGSDATAAVSSGAIVSTAEWAVKALLFLIAIPFAAWDIHAQTTSGNNQAAIWIILAVIIAAGIAASVIVLIPRVRRLASTRLRPHLVSIWGNVKAIAAEPHKIVYVLADSTLARLAVILALGASLHAVGQHASIATLITVNTLAAISGGAVPGGAGVVEAGLIAGLTAVGIPQDEAIVAVLIQRVFTSYLPGLGLADPGLDAPTRVHLRPSAQQVIAFIKASPPFGAGLGRESSASFSSGAAGS